MHTVRIIALASLVVVGGGCAGSSLPASGDGGARAGDGGAGVSVGGGNHAGGSGALASGSGGSSAGGAPGVGGTGPAASSSSGTEGPTSGSGGGLVDCATLARSKGWTANQYTCDADGSHGWCNGTGTPTSDCKACCGPSCGVLAQHYGESDAKCDDGSNDACNGAGTVTWDCSHGCCGANIPNEHPPMGVKFGYPLGDLTTSPTGGQGWAMYQVLGDYWADYGGAHLAEDIGKSDGAHAQVHAVADGTVLVAAPNSSTYKNVILISHQLDANTVVCSFYGHLESLSVAPGARVTRGQVIASLLDQGTNSHLHYFVAPKDLCDHIASLDGGGACGYDGSSGVPGLGHADIAHEQAEYRPSGTNAGCSLAGYAIDAPHLFIDAHHF